MSTESLHAPSHAEGVTIPAMVRDLRSFREWAHSDEFPERGSISYVRGEIIVDMNAEELDSHVSLKGNLYADLLEIVEKEGLGDLFVDGLLFVNEEADVSNEPDLIFCAIESLEAGRVGYREHVPGSGRLVEVTGSPDLLVEIVSRSSVKKDMLLLFESYFEAGVREYWTIDARGIEIDFRIHRRGAAGFVANDPDADGFVASEVLGRSFRLTRTRTRSRRWRYRLLSR
ncbi:MAG: Uma2 family endonuclease [Planctomycetaceae bacterium]